MVLHRDGVNGARHPQDLRLGVDERRPRRRRDPSRRPVRAPRAAPAVPVDGRRGRRERQRSADVAAPLHHRRVGLGDPGRSTGGRRDRRARPGRGRQGRVGAARRNSRADPKRTDPVRPHAGGSHHLPHAADNLERTSIRASPSRFRPSHCAGSAARGSEATRPMPHTRSCGLASTRTREPVPSR